MKTLFVIDGAAGSGKSDLLEFVQDRLAGKRVCVLQKMSTRTLRDAEKRSAKQLDLQFVDAKKFARLKKEPDFISYTYPKRDGASYGIFASQIRKTLETVDSVFLIIRSAAAIKDIADRLPGVRIVPIFVYTIESLIAERLRKENHSESEIRFRVARSPEAMGDYYHNISLYRYVIINNSEKAIFHKQLHEIYEKEMAIDDSIMCISASETYRLPAAFRRHRAKMQRQLDIYPFEKNVFVMMKYRDSNEALYRLIAAAVETKGYNCVRADQPEWNLTNDEVYNPFAVLFCCKYGIALFDEAEEGATYNANVVAELALMQMQDKTCLMLRHGSLPKPPFDLAAKIHRDYNRDGETHEIVLKWLSNL